MCCGEDLEGDSDNIKAVVLEAETEGLDQVSTARSQQPDTCTGLRCYYKESHQPT